MDTGMSRAKNNIRIAIMFFLILLLTGCESRNKTENMEWVFQACEVEGLEGTVNELSVISDREFYVATGIAGADDTISERIYYVNLDENKAKQIPVSLEAGVYITDIVRFREDGFAAFRETVDAKEEIHKDALIIVNREGEIQVSRQIQDILGTQEVITLLATDAGKLFLVSSACIYELGKDLSNVKEYQTPTQIVNATITKDGKLVCICAGDRKETGAKISFCRLDPEKEKWEKSFIIDLDQYDVPIRLISGQKSDFYLFGVNGIYECGENRKGYPLLKYSEERLGEETWNCLTVLSGGEFFSCSNESGESVLGYVSQEKAKAPKTTIVVGGIFMDYSVVRELKEYHQTHPDVMVEVREYECDYRDVTSMNDACNRLNADILSGNGPDIIYLQGLDRVTLAKQGLLEPLDPYFEKESEISKEDLIPSFREALTIDDSIFFLVPSFSIMTLVGKTGLVGDSMGWTMKEAYECWKENGADAFALEQESTFKTLIYGLMQNDKVEIEDIRLAMEMANLRDGDTLYTTDKNAGLKDGTVLLAFGGMTEPQYIQMLHAMFNEESITLKGYPGLEGSGAMFAIDNSLGISSKSKQKDVAWDMIKIFMTKKYQAVESGNVSYFPTRKDCFEEMLREYSKKKSEYNHFLGVEMRNNEDKIIIAALSGEDAERIRQMVYETKMIYHSSYLFDMVKEEAASYFDGNKELEEAFEIIKNRIDLYYNENQ